VNRQHSEVSGASPRNLAASASPRGALSNAGWNAFATIWNIAISFLVTPVLIYYLGAAEYGLVVLVWSVTGVLAVTNLGAGEATLRYVSHYLADGDMRAVNRVFGSTLAFYMLICAAVSMVLVPATPTVVGWINMPPEGRELAGSLLRLAALLFSLGMIGNAFRSIPMALHRYDISSKIAFGQGSARTLGSIGVVVLGFGVLQVILWEIVVALAVLCLQVAIARKLLPALRPWPRISLPAMREIFGYGVFSFLTHIFLTMYRESGKLVLSSYAGPTAVAYLGTADSIAYRVYMVVVSGIETLMPKFSANRDLQVARALVAKATEAAMVIAVVLFVPLATLMGDLLSLWINPEFAREGAAVGQLLAISFIAPAAFAPIATFYRGTGKPGFVTAVLAVVGLSIFVSSLLLVPAFGATGVGWGYMLSSIGWLGGLVWGWILLFGARPVMPLVRSVVVPLLLAAVVFTIQRAIRAGIGELSWFGLIAVGASFAALTATLMVIIDQLLGTDSFIGDVLAWLWASPPAAVLRRIHLGQTR
jgi:O-antigen/teichoic acid export membrane protein